MRTDEAAICPTKFKCSLLYPQSKDKVTFLRRGWILWTVDMDGWIDIQRDKEREGERE